ncbi:MAG: pilus assembly protein [Chloroflexi bacterium]|nr:pilus assembly protein [Chloroflexota bacterium]
MRRLLKTLVELLDGTPAVYGDRRRGQSVVELALVTPILIVLLMGLVEVGWFANNFLILLETTRVGARYGTVQQGDTSPLSWNNDGSLVPNSIQNFYPPDLTTDTQRIGVRDCNSVVADARYRGFYSVLTCVMLQSMDPLDFKQGAAPDGGEFPDDFTISVFALQLIDPARVPAAHRNKLAVVDLPNLTVDQEKLLPRVLVVGRYPTNANECTVDDEGNGFAWDSRDPFDYLTDNVRTYDLRKDEFGNDLPNIEENRIYYELSGYDPFNAGDPNSFERQRGFSYVGQHYVGGAGVNCLGSEWTIAEVEQLINLPGFGLEDTTERNKLASFGLVLVEMFWQHELLLKNPVFNPVFTILGDNTTISVWAAFPVPAVEPRIRFP